MDQSLQQQNSAHDSHGICVGWTQDFYQRLKAWWATDKSMHFKSLDDFLDSFPSEFVPTMEKQMLIDIWQKCGIIDFSVNNESGWIKVKQKYFLVNGICILEGDIKTLDKNIQHDLLLFLQEFTLDKGKVFISGDVINDSKSLLKHFN